MVKPIVDVIKTEVGNIADCWRFFFSQKGLDRRYERMADIGCGDGRFQSAFFSAASVYGFDIDESVSERFESRSITGVRENLFMTPDALSAIPDNFFDCVLSVGLFELIDEESLKYYLRQISRVTRSGADIILVWYPWRLASSFYFPYIIKGGKKTYEKDAGLHVYSYSIRQIESVICGMAVKKIETGFINPFSAGKWSSQSLELNKFSRPSGRCGFWFGGRYFLAKKV